MGTSFVHPPKAGAGDLAVNVTRSASSSFKQDAIWRDVRSSPCSWKEALASSIMLSGPAISQTRWMILVANAKPLCDRLKLKIGRPMIRLKLTKPLYSRVKHALTPLG